ncbi:MAG: CvpA family protein [Actinomycetota bacterium]|nr:CvpA family protein [Actinomycetota bacterium]
MNWVDPIIILLVLLATLNGTAIGLVGGIFEILSLVAGLIVASKYYSPWGNLLANLLPIPKDIANILGFGLLFLLIRELILSFGGLIKLPTRNRLVRLVNGVGGGLVGLFAGVVVTGLILVLLTAFPLNAGLTAQIRQSHLGPKLIDAMTELYVKTEAALPLEVPKLAFYPEKLATKGDLRAIDFSTLDGATCIACEGKVKFLGYFRNKYGSASPKFVCTKCGRVSDGCQTFEGHHLMYGQCPAVLGRQGYRFDCGVWTNGNFAKPVGTCPVCGERALEVIPMEVAILGVN